MLVHGLPSGDVQPQLWVCLPPENKHSVPVPKVRITVMLDRICETGPDGVEASPPGSDGGSGSQA